MPIGKEVGKSALLTKVKLVSEAERKKEAKMAKFMENRKNDKKATMDKLRAERLKLANLSAKDIGK